MEEIRGTPGRDAGQKPGFWEKPGFLVSKCSCFSLERAIMPGGGVASQVSLRRQGGCVVDSFAVWRLIVCTIILRPALVFHPVNIGQYV